MQTTLTFKFLAEGLVSSMDVRLNMVHPMTVGEVDMEAFPRRLNAINCLESYREAVAGDLDGSKTLITRPITSIE